MSEATKTITPTPGRAVWYYPSQDEINAKQFACGDPSQPLAATVAYVWSDRMVNLSVLDQNGNQFRRTSVALVQPGDEPKRTSEGPFATWMPYQIGQAKAAADAGTVGSQNLTNREMTEEERAALVQQFKQAEAQSATDQPPQLSVPAASAQADTVQLTPENVATAVAKKVGKASGKIAT